MPLQSKDTDARKSVCSGDLATLSPRKKRAMSWSEDCHGRPRARTTVSSSTSSSFVLYERPPTSHINVAWVGSRAGSCRAFGGTGWVGLVMKSWPVKQSRTFHSTTLSVHTKNYGILYVTGVVGDFYRPSYRERYRLLQSVVSVRPFLLYYLNRLTIIDLHFLACIIWITTVDL